MPRIRRPRERSPEAGRIRRLRAAAGFTQRELAEAFNVTLGAVSLWENGERTVPGPALRLLELYERNLGLEAAPDEDDRITWLSRNTANAQAFVLWTMLVGLDSFDTSPIAKRVRVAAMRQFVRTLGELKGLSMKFGQTMANLNFALSEPDRRALVSIQGVAKAMPPTVVRDVLLEELDQAPKQLFKTWSKDPVAVASIGQVHAAITHDDRRVAVKVQYPRIVEMLSADLRNIGLLDRAASLVYPAQKPEVIYDEYRARFLSECDYRLEAENQRLFRRVFAHRIDIAIPEPIAELCTGRVLTSTWAEGVSLDDFAASASPSERDRAGATVWDFYYESIFRHGIYNTDPHPGNLLFAKDRVHFLDFGRIKTFTPRIIGIWKAMVRAVLERDLVGLGRELIRAGCVPNPEDFDYHHAYRTLLCIHGPCLSDGPFEFTPAFVQRAWEMVNRRNRNRPRTNYPAELIFVDQLYFGVSALLARLRARVDCCKRRARARCRIGLHRA